MSIPREERLLNLVALLLDRSATLDEIREHIAGYPPEEASARRQFERDKDLLRDSGILMVTETPNDGQGTYRYRIAQPKLLDLSLSEDERRSVQLALASATFDEQSKRHALNKLGGVESDQLRESVRIDLIPDPRTDVFWDAIRDSEVVRFSYRDEVRELEPWGLAFRYGNLYVVGHDRVRDAPRVFRLDRMTDMPTRVAGLRTSGIRPPRLQHLFDTAISPPVQARISMDQIGSAILGVSNEGWDAGTPTITNWRAIEHSFADQEACFRALAECSDHAVLLEPESWRDAYLAHLPEPDDA